MISYLIDGAILAVLLGLGIKLYLIGRQIRQLRSYHDHYQFVLDETAAAAAAVDASIRDLNTHGAQVLLALGERIGDGHKLITEMDERMEALNQHYEAERTAAGNVLQFAAAAGKAAMRRTEESRFERRPAPAPEMHEEYEPEPPRRQQSQAPARRPRQETAEPAVRRTAPVEREVKWPTLGDRFNSWRNSDVEEPRKAPRPRQNPAR